MSPDPKPAPRAVSPWLYEALHREWRTCALAHRGGCLQRLSLHHINKHPRDDLTGNLVMLCGDGTSGHHGLIESHHLPTKIALGIHLLRARQDTWGYLVWRMDGDEERVYEWFANFMSAKIG